MIHLNANDLALAKSLAQLKAASGSHSPSIATLKEALPSLKITIDACFLSNPYATDLFMQELESKLLAKQGLRDALEFYPSQNHIIAQKLAKYLHIDSPHIFIGNGAIEVIQAVLHNFVQTNLVVPIPTFSSYYEFVRNDAKVLLYKLPKEQNYTLDIEAYTKFIKDHNAKNALLINPNNPDGSYIPYDTLRECLARLRHLDTIIIDESFLHFAYEDSSLEQISYTKLAQEFSNVVLIKSMSKDFGVAGLRAGYGIMAENRVRDLLRNGYLWNVNGLSEFFFNLFSDDEFLQKYERVRRSYITQTQEFFKALGQINSIKTYPSKANFALIELLNGTKAQDLCIKLLSSYGIYTRSCNDKIGLEGEFLRIASRSEQENAQILQALQEIFSAC
ncbi:pyridoxal phosphate-dependent aminotransferase [Helicobacter zhangjianzhongii]|uniref:Histidinol-phosphate aminotransferase family protein n=1 Tax=Helicobacter zhangjianzhongii TaxID=2974574 RepID=A0ACC6FQ57_9HELI|nr:MULTISPECIES: histidinol-phosphate transaminase [unclassified Helicobacter]MDL0079072.1 histidinol-phosphate aminotransferase family protein [Helicobacter sp. CPD2-1]MDL0081098.1 histidinol-phosphate aminotransferase family protein [Helicobacter sp. XJK30-2]